MRKAWSSIICALLFAVPLTGSGQDKPKLEVKLLKVARDALGPNGWQPNPSDVREALREKGLKLPEGSEAWFDWELCILMLRSVPEDYLHALTILPGPQPLTESAGLEISVTGLAWRQKDPVAVALGEPVSVETLRGVALADLQVISSQQLRLRSAVRARTEFRGEDVLPKQYEGMAEWWEEWDGPERVVDLEVDPMINPDGTTISLNFSWRLTVPSARSPERRLELSVLTALDLWTGEPVVMEAGSIPGEEPVQFLVLVEASVQRREKAEP